MILVSDIYQSRVDNEAAIIARQDPVVYSGSDTRSDFALTQSQLRRYRKDGFLFLKGFFQGEEIDHLQRETERIAQDESVKAREEVIMEPSGNEVRSVFMVHKLSELLGQLVSDRRLAGIAQQILGGDVYIHQSRLNLKPGFSGGEFFWHSDFETWHVEDDMPRMRALSCTVLLSENNEFNGPLMLIPGSHMHFISCVGKTPEDHYKQSLRKQEYGVPDTTSLKFLTDRGGLRALKGPAGSVIFFDCNTMHGSSSNISPYPRSNLFFVYNSANNVLNNPRGGLAPRPEFIASRLDVTPVIPRVPDYSMQH